MRGSWKAESGGWKTAMWRSETNLKEETGDILGAEAGSGGGRPEAEMRNT